MALQTAQGLQVPVHSQLTIAATIGVITMIMRSGIKSGSAINVSVSTSLLVVAEPGFHRSSRPRAQRARGVTEPVFHPHCL